MGTPNSSVADLMDKIRWHADWEGELPPPPSREQFEKIIEPFVQEQDDPKEAKRHLLEEFDRFRELLENYHLADKKIFHRRCGGGAVVQANSFKYCRRCGYLPSNSSALN